MKASVRFEASIFAFDFSVAITDFAPEVDIFQIDHAEFESEVRFKLVTLGDLCDLQRSRGHFSL